MLDKCTLKDRKSTKELLQKLKLPSVNQLAIEVKLLEVRKSINDKDYPIQLEKNHINGGENESALRPSIIWVLKRHSKDKNR